MLKILRNKINVHIIVFFELMSQNRFTLSLYTVSHHSLDKTSFIIHTKHKMFKKLNVPIGGIAEPEFGKVKDVFQENFTNGNEISAQLCIVKQGKIVSIQLNFFSFQKLS